MASRRMIAIATIIKIAMMNPAAIQFFPFCWVNPCPFHGIRPELPAEPFS
jgi:hypothetical protein